MSDSECFTCIVPETAPVQKSQALVEEILQGHFPLLLEAGKNIRKAQEVKKIYCLYCDYVPSVLLFTFLGGLMSGWMMLLRSS